MNQPTRAIVAGQHVQVYDEHDEVWVRGVTTTPTVRADGASCFPGWWVKVEREEGRKTSSYQVGVATEDIQEASAPKSTAARDEYDADNDELLDAGMADLDRPQMSGY